MVAHDKRIPRDLFEARLFSRLPREELHTWSTHQPPLRAAVSPTQEEGIWQLLIEDASYPLSPTHLFPTRVVGIAWVGEMDSPILLVFPSSEV